MFAHDSLSKTKREKLLSVETITNWHIACWYVQTSWISAEWCTRWNEWKGPCANRILLFYRKGIFMPYTQGIGWDIQQFSWLLDKRIAKAAVLSLLNMVGYIETYSTTWMMIWYFQNSFPGNNEYKIYLIVFFFSKGSC